MLIVSIESEEDKIMKAKNTPLCKISPQLRLDESDLLMGNFLEKISEVDIRIEDLESEHPSIIKELDIDSQQE